VDDGSVRLKKLKKLGLYFSEREVENGWRNWEMNFQLLLHDTVTAVSLPI
jgi:hypothetical protein